MIQQSHHSKRIAAASDTKKFDKKDLEEAYRRLTSTKYDNAIEKLKNRSSKTENTQHQQNANASSQVRSLDTGVKVCARKLNECKARADRLQEDLGKKEDEKSELERQNQILEDMLQGNNEEAKKIGKLKVDIEDANNLSEKKLKYRLQLNYMHQRQRRNTVSVDAHISAMSTTLAMADKERQRCKKMLGDIESGVASATHDLEETSKNINVERARRLESMNSKKNEVTNAERMEEWRKIQETNRLKFEHGLDSYQLEKERKLSLIKEREHDIKVLGKTIEAKSSGQGSSEEIFMNIKRATGVNSLNEMVEKISNHKEQRMRLQAEKKESEDRLYATQQALQNATSTFNDLRSNGFGSIELNREVIEEISIEIEKERTQGKAVKSANSRLEGVLVGIRQGGIGLHQRLIPFHPTFLDGDAPTLDETITPSASQAANETLEMLKIAKQVITKMLDSVGGIGMVLTQDDNVHNDTYKEKIAKLENPNLGESNCRIMSKESYTQAYEEECFEEMNGSDQDSENIMILSRAMLKAQSEEQAGEAKRLEDLDVKRQTLKEKESSDDNGHATIVAKKIQEESISRMAKHILPIGYPKSVSIRDDPLTKAQAFLSQVPTIE